MPCCGRALRSKRLRRFLWSPLGWSGRSHLVVLVQKPVLFWIVQRVDHLGHQFILLSDLQHGAGVLVTTTVVSSREDSEQLTACKALKAVHDALVGTQNISAPVGVKEVLDTIWAELDDVASAIGVSDKVWLDT